MRVYLLKRNKITHCGINARIDGMDCKISICNKIWNIDDKVTIGDQSEVTCKRCQKIIARADENGVVDL